MTATAVPPKPAPTAAPARAPETGGELRRVPLLELVESPWNPRKTFAPAALQEMVDSLREKGQLAPLIVRPVNAKMPGSAFARYEIGAGHRRYRAAPAAGLTHLLVVVREMHDVAFLELLTIENKLRADLQPLEEAAGFRLLMEKAGYDVAKLAARIGLSVKYVYDRLKLLQLIPAAKSLLAEGTITAGHAILIARLSKDDQARVVDQDAGGLFEDETIHDELDLEGEPVKARSVRELETWINDHVRLPPAAVDPFLFPETATALAGATQARAKVVQVTHDWTAHQDVRHDGAKERVYGAQSWKRADGKQKSKACPYSALGVVVSGYGQGEAFRVCVNRDRCATHWPQRAKKAKANAKAKAAGRDPYAEQQERERLAHEKEKAEQRRWKQATPALLKALAAAIKTGDVKPGSPVWRELMSWAGRERGGKGEVQPGTSAESLARYLAFTLVAGELNGYSWRPWDEFPRHLKPFGIDAVAIVDQVAPKPKPAPAAKPTPKKKGKRA